MKTTTPSVKHLGLLLVLCLLFNIFNTNAQIRLVKTDTTTDQITIKNFGNSNVDITDYWLCARFAYSQLSTLTSSGSLDLAPDAETTITGFSLNNTSSDVGLYLDINSNADFGNQNFMVDFVQYGASGLGRESVANAKGIWTSGDFLSGTGPFFYNGDGAQNGVSFWGTTLSINDEFLNSVISVYPSPAKEDLNFKILQQINLKDASIFDMTGRLVEVTNLDKRQIQNKISLKTMKSGVYVLKLTDLEGRTLTRKFIKQ